jgi:sugar phosphate isomerase/epimerase
VQLHLDPIREGAWTLETTHRELRDAGVTILSGMMSMQGEDYSTLESIARTGGVRPDSTWHANFKAAERNATIAKELGLTLVTFHAGFLPHGGSRAEQAERAKMIERLRQLAEVFGSRGVRVALETGQEKADTLLSVLKDVNAGLGDARRVGVNFDPANMILYGMGDPIAALRALRGQVVQVHVKDAVATTTPGTWGEEVPVGKGQVDWKAFFGVLGEGAACDCVIEREAGEARVEDVRTARDLVVGLVGRDG